MNKINSRKLLVFIFCSIIIWVAYFISITLCSDITALLTITSGVQLFLASAYIGGNVWSGYIKSKYYKQELDK